MASKFHERLNTIKKSKREFYDTFNVICSQMKLKNSYIHISHQNSLIISHHFNKRGSKNTSIACIIKLFTSTLVAQLIEQEKISLNSLISEILKEETESLDIDYRILQGITIYHLLTHAHGLGNIRLEGYSLVANNSKFINYHKVLNTIAKEGKLFEAGSYPSYGNTGYILLGIILEKYRKMSYKDILFKFIFSKLSNKKFQYNKSYELSNEYICPAQGNGLNIPETYLSSFAEFFINEKGCLFGLSRITRELILNLSEKIPGWSPMVKNMCIGWKDYGNNWYGHDGAGDNSYSILRVNPVNYIALIITAEATNLKTNLNYFSSRITNDIFPEFFNSNISNDLPCYLCTFTHKDKVIGSYGSNQFEYQISFYNNQLILTLIEKKTNNIDFRIHTCSLILQDSGIFSLSTPWRGVAIIQILYNKVRSHTFLWDHGQVWPCLNN